MNEKKIQETAKRHAPASTCVKHVSVAFLSGGLIGAGGQLLSLLYQDLFALKEQDALTLVAISVMLLAALLTGLGVYDRIAQKCGAGLFVPICGFANSLAASALEGKSEGLVYGIGSGMFKLAGTVLTYGIVAAVVFGSIRYLLFGGAL